MATENLIDIKQEQQITAVDDYPYMVERLYGLLNEAGVHTDHAPHKLILPPPAFVRQGRTILWTNFQRTCQAINRPLDHFKKFIEKELMITGSLNKDSALIMRIRAQPRQFESLLHKYIKTFVQCGICKGGKSTLNKDPVTRLWFVECEGCLTKRAVETL